MEESKMSIGIIFTASFSKDILKNSCAKTSDDGSIFYTISNDNKTYNLDFSVEVPSEYGQINIDDDNRQKPDIFIMNIFHDIIPNFEKNHIFRNERRDVRKIERKIYEVTFIKSYTKNVWIFYIHDKHCLSIVKEILSSFDFNFIDYQSTTPYTIKNFVKNVDKFLTLSQTNALETELKDNPLLMNEIIKISEENQVDLFQNDLLKFYSELSSNNRWLEAPEIMKKWEKNLYSNEYEFNDAICQKEGWLLLDGTKINLTDLSFEIADIYNSDCLIHTKKYGGNDGVTKLVEQVLRICQLLKSPDKFPDFLIYCTTHNINLSKDIKIVCTLYKPRSAIVMLNHKVMLGLIYFIATNMYNIPCLYFTGKLKIG